MHSHEQLSQRRHLEGEKPMVSVCPETDMRITHMREGSTYMITKCLESSLFVTGYAEAFHRQKTAIGTMDEYFRPDASPSELFVEPGDTLEILEVNETQGYIHAMITLFRGRTYELHRVIPLCGYRLNAEKFMVTRPEREDGVGATVIAPDAPLDDEALVVVAAYEEGEPSTVA